MEIEKWRLPYEMERQYEYRKWMNEIPYIKFPSGWEVRLIPPFGGAIVRFWVKKNEVDRVSAYLDCYDLIGSFGEPYWEVYPFGEDVGRCKMNETDLLISMIQDSLDSKK